MPKPRKGNSGRWMEALFSLPLKSTKVVATKTASKNDEFAVRAKHAFY
jgi:hypothetical protein